MPRPRCDVELIGAQIGRCQSYPIVSMILSKADFLENTMHMEPFTGFQDPSNGTYGGQ